MRFRACKETAKYAFIMRTGILPGIFVLLWMPKLLYGQNFFFGADLSYVNEMEECGAVYTVNGETRDPYAIFKDHGCNLVRLRLWHTPSWYDGLNLGHRFSDFADVRQSIARAKSKGMDVLLDFHLSDNWADPAHQVVPAAWAPIVDNLAVLQDSLYQYIYSTLYKLGEDDLLPRIVQIGNETNKGILQSQQQNDSGWALHWPKNRALFNSAIDAVRDIETITGKQIDVALHFADPEDVYWLLDQFWNNNVRDFDIIGISYYAAYHPVTIQVVGQLIEDLRFDYPGKSFMVFETAYPWTNQNADAANNLISTSVPGYPLSPANQKKWMVDLTQAVIDHGGSGVVYWEPAWVSTGCSTQWASGSHWDNCTFFDFDQVLIADGGIGWMSHPYEFPTAVTDPKSNDGIHISYVHDRFQISFGQDFVLSQPLYFTVLSIDGKEILSARGMTQAHGNTWSVEFRPGKPGVFAYTLSTAEGIMKTGKIFTSR